ncbi:MAG: aminoglycoside phosphotransferase family protein, partial [Anaerolineaceae bacterium]|nr:aminoglycoside phosphotransferase family protein [Anaerolineaceae bacterium]
MKQPQKWRETIDPFSLSYKRFNLSQVLGYPHAGNDVFYVAGAVEGQSVRGFLKVERQTGANISNEIQIIRQLPFPTVPKILDYSLDHPSFIVTEELPGERLSVILGENQNKQSLNFLYTYGKALARFHQLTIDCDPVADRRVFHPLPEAFYQDNNLLEIHNYLINHPPTNDERCFVHGDFHYANILW